MLFPFFAEDDSVVDIGFTASQINYQAVNLALKCRWGVLLSKRHNFVLIQSVWCNECCDLFCSVCQRYLLKSLKQVKFRNIFGLSNAIDAVIDLWDGKSVCFGDRIYFTVVRTHAKCPIRFWNKNTKRTPFTLTRFYKVIIQQILNFFSENMLFYRVRSVWMLFHRF